MKNKWMQGPETDLSIDFFYSNILIDPKQNYALLISRNSNSDEKMELVMYEINKGFFLWTTRKSLQAVDTKKKKLILKHYDFYDLNTLKLC